MAILEELLDEANEPAPQPLDETLSDRRLLGRN
jgi:hypothetical protein